MSHRAISILTIAITTTVILFTLQLTSPFAFAQPLPTIAAAQTQPQPSEHTVPDPDIAVEDNCLNPDPDMLQSCQVIEQQLLASTIRFEIRRATLFFEDEGYFLFWGVGHGTVSGGRYLITHNHQSKTHYSDLPEGSIDEQITLSFFHADGSLLTHLTNASVKVAMTGSETLVFDFGEQNEVGFFESLGIPSAPILTDISTIQPGNVVAQINWNQSNTFVEWTTVRSVTVHDGVQVVELDNAVIQGASGGGIFIDGQHIANNWKVISISNASSGAVTDSFTVAALNG